MDYQKRIERLRAKMKHARLDGLLVAKPENRTYLCGYRGGDHGIEETSGILIIPKKGKIRLLTDFRFQLQAEREAPGVEVLIYRQGMLQLLPELLGDLGINTLGFESHYTLHSAHLKLEKALSKKKITTVATTSIVESMRVIKDQDEIDCIRKSVQLNEKVFQQIYSSFDQFETELDVAIAVETTMKEMGAEKPSFDTIVASGKNGALPHAVPGPSIIKRNRSLTLDMGLVLDGYCSDMTRNFVPGKPSKKYIKLHRIVRKAQLAGLEALKAGVRAIDVDKAARKVIDKAGYSRFFGHGLGHGVGLAVHEEPRLSPKSKKKLKPGMIVTVEPGIYIPSWGGIRLENMVVVTEDGFDNLNSDKTWLDL